MPTSGTTNFNLQVEEIVEKALDLVGGEMNSAEDARQARRSLNLLLIDMQNRGHPLAKLEKYTFLTSVSAQTEYTLTSAVVDVLDVTLIQASTSTTTPLERISLFDYHRIPNKGLTGLPSQFAIDRDRDSTKIHLYLTPNSTAHTISYWAVTKIEDVTRATENVDISTRYLPAIVMGLAYFMSLERTGFDAEKRAELRQNYADMLEAAYSEDRDRTSFYAFPHNYYP